MLLLDIVHKTPNKLKTMYQRSLVYSQRMVIHGLLIIFAYETPIDNSETPPSKIVHCEEWGLYSKVVIQVKKACKAEP